jgi:predicted O-linked N-acetylglucosamine transferase (SPINDLY family)
LFDAIPKYPYVVTTTIPEPVRLEVPFTLRGQRYTAFIAPAQITDPQTKQERLVFPGGREELVERALRFIAVQQIAKTKLVKFQQRYQRRHRKSRNSTISSF